MNKPNNFFTRTPNPKLDSEEEFKMAKEKEAINERFIFDSSQIWRKEDFSMIKLNDNTFAYCLFLPLNVTKDSKMGGSYIEQQFKPVVIDSNLVINEFNQVFKQKYKLDFVEIPFDFNKMSWKVERIKEDILEKNTLFPNENLKNIVYKSIKKQYETYLSYNCDDWYIINSLWDMSTYCFKLFNKFPIKENRGFRGTGKTKTMQLSRLISYNGVQEDIMINPTIAILFRGFGETKGARFIDEAESIFRYEKGKLITDERAEIINACYEKSGTISRLEKKGNQFIRKRYPAYCPIQTSSIIGLFGATEDRAIVQNHIKTLDSDDRGEKDIDEHNYIYEQIRGDMFLLILTHWQEIESIYTNLETNGLKNRDFAIWRPILTMAKFISQDVFNSVLNFAKAESNRKKYEISEDSFEANLIKIAYSCLGDNSFVLISSIKEFWTGEERPHEKTISRLLDKFGFRELKTHTRNGNGYQFENKKHFLMLITSNFPSFASQKLKEIEDKEKNIREEEVKDVNENEVNEGNVKQNQEDIKKHKQISFTTQLDSFTTPLEDKTQNVKQVKQMKQDIQQAGYKNNAKDWILQNTKQEKNIEELKKEFYKTNMFTDISFDDLISSMLLSGDLMSSRSGFVRLLE